MYWQSASQWIFSANYTASLTYNVPTGNGSRVLVVSLLRGNTSSINNDGVPLYDGVPMIRVVKDFGTGSSYDATQNLYYLLNPSTGSKTLTVYQGVEGNGSSVQNMFIVATHATSSVGTSIFFETSSCFMSSSIRTNHSIVSAYDNGFVFERTSHDNSTVNTSPDQTYTRISSSDYGSYTSYWGRRDNVTITASGEFPARWTAGGGDDWTSVIVAFYEQSDTPPITQIDQSSMILFFND